MEFLIGGVSGIISSLGMGGGTILILFLTLFMNVPLQKSQATNLVFFVPTSIISIIINTRQKLVDFKIGLAIGLFGIIGAILGAKVSFLIDSNQVKRYFGIFLIFIACYEIYSLIKGYKSAKNSK